MWYHDRMQIEGTESTPNPLLLSSTCNRRMAVCMVPCANSIPIPCSHIFAGRRLAQWWLLALEPLRHWAFAQRGDWAAEAAVAGLALYLGAVRCHPRWVPAGQGSPRRSSWSPVWALHHQHRLGPPWKQLQPPGRWDSSVGSWALVCTRAACLPAAASQRRGFLAPCVCTSSSGAEIVLEAFIVVSY